MFVISDNQKRQLSMIIFIVSCLVVLFSCCYYISQKQYVLGYQKGLEDGKKSITVSSPIEDPTLDTVIDVNWKDNNDDPDLIVNNHYKATINGNTIDIPLKDKKIKEPLESQPSSSDAPSKVTAKVEQELDLSPLFKDYEKKKQWEVGTGVGVLDNKWYVPVEVQRNFDYNKAVEVQLSVSNKTIEGVQATYKIRF